MNYLIINGIPHKGNTWKLAEEVRSNIQRIEKVLIVSDVPDKKYWDYYKEGDLDDFELIISCWDLPPQYLLVLVYRQTIF